MSVTEKRGFFGVVADPQSHQNILYLLLAIICFLNWYCARIEKS
jgi:hypothetical protein